MDSDKKLLSSIKEKPYFKKDNFVLYKKNCEDLLKELPENSIDMIFADPPYLLSNGGFTCKGGKMVNVNKGSWDVSNGIKKDFGFHLSWIKACHRVLKPEGTIWISGTYHSIYQCGFALQVNKFHILNDIAWFKPNASPNLSCRFFTASHETLVWARKEKKAKHKFNYELMKNGDWPEDFIKKPNLQMRSVWSINTPKPIEKKFGKHPTQKSFDLLKRIVLASTNKNDLILDPFTGSSTTGIAACLYDRKFIGIDIEKQYLDLSIKRFEDLYKNIKTKSGYIPSEEHWIEMFSHYNFFEIKRKYPISKIKIDPERFSYKNNLNKHMVFEMAKNFDLNSWMPITIATDSYLLDGQHRLELAKNLKLKFIDVVVQDEQKMKLETNKKQR